MISRMKVSTSRSRLETKSRKRVQRSITEALEDRRLFAVGLVSVGIGGAAANGDSAEASVSSDGRYVVFSSFATNLVANDTNGHKDIFLRDRNTGTTVMVSKNPTTGEGGNKDSTQPVINADGTYVAFVSRATNLISGDTQNHNDIFRYNIATGAIELVSARSGTTSTFAGGSSSEPTISKDGSLVSFTSFAANLNAGIDGNDNNDVFVRNMGSTTVFGLAPNATKLISVNSGNVAAGNSQSFDSWISSDGRYIAFRSDSSDMVASGDTNNARDTFVRDLQTGTTALISQTPAGASGNASSDSNSISGDGRFVTFQSKATDLVSNDGNANSDVFLRDTQTNTTTLLSINRFGTNSAGGFSEFPALSQDGSFASFSSTAGDIINGDTNGREDVFLRDLVRGPISLVSINTSGAAANGRSFDPFISRNGDFVVFTSDASDISTGDTNGKSDIFLSDSPGIGGGGGGGGSDSTLPTATVGSAESATPGATTFQFTVNLADNVGLNTVTVGNLTVTKAGGSAQTATLVNVVGTGVSAVATYSVAFPSGINTNDTGLYTVTTTAGAIKDAAGNAIAGGTSLGTFTLAIGDPNGPDLVIVKPGKTKASYIGGAKGALKWKLQNNGPGTLTNKTVEFKVYTSADGTLDAGDATLGTISKLVKKLKPTKSIAAALKFTFPNDINGNFFLLIKADTANTIAESNETNNTGSTVAATLIQPPFRDLQPTVVSKPSRLTAGLPITATATIKNNGNTTFNDLVPITLVVTDAGVVNDGSTVLVTTTQKLSLAPGKSKTVKFSATLPGNLAVGQYQLGVDVDPANAFAESDEGNNTALSLVWQSFV
ncbi:CARDB domain-containing protein [Humisphaera borealis]|uniref:PD40 domain-containing protein n=1 Tax=Humisphaera borealis TaxID=2807512 RepID=A0A7M2WV08_9BACT|nr:CARDB domain-containing protein [Humisphaera borealis]QOV89052.1 PD40 domain-containing protein [Humisphaera borealis]